MEKAIERQRVLLQHLRPSQTSSSLENIESSIAVSSFFQFQFSVLVCLFFSFLTKFYFWFVFVSWFSIFGGCVLFLLFNSTFDSVCSINEFQFGLLGIFWIILFLIVWCGCGYFFILICRLKSWATVQVLFSFNSEFNLFCSWISVWFIGYVLFHCFIDWFWCGLFYFDLKIQVLS